MQQEPSSARNNGKSSNPTNQISKEKIQQGLGNQVQNQERIMSEWQQGTLLKNGRFMIQKRLGEGGFGITYLARDEKLNRHIVIKTLKKKVRVEKSFEECKQDFRQEAQRLSLCCHHNNTQRC